MATENGNNERDLIAEMVNETLALEYFLEFQQKHPNGSEGELEHFLKVISASSDVQSLVKQKIEEAKVEKDRKFKEQEAKMVVMDALRNLMPLLEIAMQTGASFAKADFESILRPEVAASFNESRTQGASFLEAYLLPQLPDATTKSIVGERLKKFPKNDLWGAYKDLLRWSAS